MKINILVPYEKAELNCEVWANSENSIDFYKDLFEAARCTVCYAASELKAWLQKVNIECFYNSDKAADYVIELKIEDYTSASEEYTLTPTAGGVKIFGKGKAGVLYGCYELLKMQGFRWYAPGITGTVVPKTLESIVFPEKEIAFAPDMDYGRGFDFENYSVESVETWNWMARNRLNVGAYSPKFYHLQKKLCVTIKTGGHIFEKMLSPDRMLSDGKTIFEGHKDWYGVRKDKMEITPVNCLTTQFCVSNHELVEFLANELISLFKNEWKYVDRADIWGFDTWGSVCDCEKCQKLGNATDITLYFINELRKAINKTEIKDRVHLISCAYEGTCTMEPPTHPIPQEMLDAGDCVVFYPINRCYEHNFGDEDCPTNNRYNSLLAGWSEIRQNMPIIIGEYYNVSRFEDLPIVFIDRLKNDLPHYYSMGVRGITYMHIPLLNMGIRSLTHLLYAELSWDTKADADKIIAEYFDLYYEKYSAQAKEIYLLLQEAFKGCTQWRSWGANSILDQLINWNCLKPSVPLKADTHIATHEEIFAAGEKAVGELETALNIIDSVLEDDLYTKFELFSMWTRNPVEQRKKSEQTKMFKRISEVRCFLIYALDSFKFMLLLTRMYDALLYDKDTKKLADELAELYKKMDSYYIPLESGALICDTVCKTALERTQLKMIAKKCISECSK